MFILLVYHFSAKKAAPAKGKTQTNKTSEKPKEKVWTKEDEAARKIQTKIRQFLAKKKLAKKKKEKVDYEEMMDRLEKEVIIIHELIKYHLDIHFDLQYMAD